MVSKLQNVNARPTVAMLREVRMLKCFNEQELAMLIPAGEPMHYEAHANVVIEGELSWGLYVLLDGVVGIFKTNKMTGDTYDVGQLRQHSFFGEMSLIDENPRSATVRALTDCFLFYISKELFIQFIDADADRRQRFYQSCIKDLVSRLRELDEGYVVSQYQLWKSALRSSKEAA